jgi:DNA (cytosine-5)-methyltransferase 1
MQKKENLNELALFAGAGGGILGGKLLGWRTVCAVEWEPYPASVLVARQNDGLLPPFPIWDDVQTFDGKPWRGIVDVVSGGFPCQDISAAGKGAGIDGERSGMWGHMARIIGEVRPRYVFVENSPMLVTRGLERVLGDLTVLGYDTKWTVMGAADVGANHKRDRIWIKAHLPNSNSISHAMRGNSQDYAERVARGYEPRGSISDSRSGCQDGARKSSQLAHSSQAGEQWKCSIQTDGCSGGIFGQDNAENAKESTNVGDVQELAQSQRKGLEGQWSQPRQQEVAQPGDSGTLAHTQNSRDVWRQWQLGFAEQKHHSGGGSTNGSREWWEAEPNVGRVANGVAARVDRLKAIGNGQVPLCAATAWRTLSQ